MSAHALLAQAPAPRQTALARQRLEAALAEAGKASTFVGNVRGEIERLAAAPVDEELARRIVTARQVVSEAQEVARDRSASPAALELAERRVVAQVGDLQRLQRELAARLGSVRNRQRVLLEAVAELRSRGEAALPALGPEDPSAVALARALQSSAAVDARAPVPDLERLRSDLDTSLEATARSRLPNEGQRNRGAAAVTQPAVTQPTAAALEPAPAQPAGARRPPSAPSSRPPATTGSATTSPNAASAEPALPFDPVPIALEDAARALFGADYGRALRVLETLPAGDPRVEVARLLLAAAASYGQYRRNGESEPHLLDSARQLVATCRGLAPGLDVAGLPFSPAFVTFFRSVPAAAPPQPPSPSSR